MKRGDLVTVAMPGDIGQPQQALVIQSDRYDQHGTVTVLPVTSAVVAAPLFRITIEPATENGLNKSSIYEAWIDRMTELDGSRIWSRLVTIQFSSTFLEGITNNDLFLLERSGTVE